MTRNAKKYLFEIITACDKVRRYLRATPTLEEYLASDYAQSALDRQLLNLGESVRRLRDEMSAEMLVNTAQIIRFRNLLAHAYEDINYEQVWQVMHEQLPLLREEALCLLDAHGGLPIAFEPE